MMSSGNVLKIKLTKSLIGTKRVHRKNAIGLGLTKINRRVEVSDNPAIRGMIKKISYLIKIED